MELRPDESGLHCHPTKKLRASFPRFFESNRHSISKSSEKSSERIILAIKGNSAVSAQELADMLGITRRAVEKHLSKLKEKGIIKRIGPDKGGHWSVHGDA